MTAISGDRKIAEANLEPMGGGSSTAKTGGAEKGVDKASSVQARSGSGPAPAPMAGTISPDPPPEAPEPQPVPLMRILMPVVMVVAVGGMVALMLFTGMGRNPMAFLFPVIMLFSMVGMMAGSATASKDISAARKDYQRHLSSIRRAIAEAARRQRQASEYHHPKPDSLWQLPQWGRAFERTSEHADFLRLRVGTATQAPATPIAPPAIPAPEKLDPVSAVALREVIRTGRHVDEVALAIDAAAFPVVAFSGEPDAARGLARALVAQVAALHAPEQVKVAFAGSEDLWQWLKWLPHHANARREDVSGPGRLRAAAFSQLAQLLLEMTLADLKALVVVVDEVTAPEISAPYQQGSKRRRRTRAAHPPGSQVPVTPDLPRERDSGLSAADFASLAAVFEAAEPQATVVVLAVAENQDSYLWQAAVDYGLALQVCDGRVSAETATGGEEIAAADNLGVAAAEVLARKLAAVPVAVRQPNRGPRGDVVLGELGLNPPQHTWVFRPRLGSQRLRIPVGTDDAGDPVYLDFKESAEGGMGPHGLCVGATGSGKSEFLKAAVVGLAACHGPDQLNFVLVDFKGGATFLGLEQLPHVSAVITNLEDELILVNRMEDALRGEITRRQEQLRAAGNFPGVAEYEAARRAGKISAPPMPALLIVVDEFSELLTARPEFAELFVAIGRLGRSLHVHLLLASQRLEEGRLRGLESHLSYRIGLKTFSAAESRSVLGVPDAYHLPAVPGIGFIKSAASDPVRFRSAYVSGPVHSGVGEAGVSGGGAVLRPVEFTAADTPSTAEALAELQESSGEDGGERVSVLEAFVRAVGHVPLRAHRVWLPPLPDEIPLQLSAALSAADTSAEVAAEVAAAPGGAGSNTGTSASVSSEGSISSHTALRARIGVVDKPLHQRQEPLWVDLRGTGGHVAVVGAPRSGKTTTLRTVMVALADSASPAQLHFYVVDFGAGGLAGIDQLPHVAAVAHRGDDEMVRRIIGFLRREIGVREALFRRNQWLSPEAARAGGAADAILIIDGWSAFKTEHAALADEVHTLVAEGLAVGIHVLLSAYRWTEFRPSLRDLLGTRIELRLAESLDSVFNRKAAELVPDNPGRGLAPGGFAMLIAKSSQADIAQVVQRVGAGVRAPELRLLPRAIDVRMLPRVAQASRGVVAVGVEEAGLGAVTFDPERDRHLLVFGSAGSGRTSAAATLIHQLSWARSDNKFVVIDYRRGLMESVPQQFLAGYAGSAAVAEPMLAELAATLRARLPQPDVTPEQLRSRSWWEGPNITLVVDDYDLVAGGRVNPLLPLADVIAHAADIGLNVVFARRIAGALRALHDPVMGAVKDQGATVFVMDGTREDGPIVGVTPVAQPPGRGLWVAHGRGAQVVQLAQVVDHPTGADPEPDSQLEEVSDER